MLNTPTSVVRSLRSARIRASTGNAVIDNATPIKTVNGPKLVWRSLFMTLYIIKDTPTPSPNGSTMPTAAIHAAAFPVLFFHNPRDKKGGDKLILGQREEQEQKGCGENKSQGRYGT